MEKTFVVDTNVLFRSPSSIMNFEGNVIIPDIVLEEIDNHKNDKGDLGLQARSAGRLLESLRLKGSLNQGVPTDYGVIRVEMGYYDAEIPPSWKTVKADNRIIQVCAGLQADGKEPILITNDTLVRVKADVVNVVSDLYEETRGPVLEDQYKGRRNVYTHSHLINSLYQFGRMTPELYGEDGEPIAESDLTVNEFFVIRALENRNQSVLGRFDGKSVVRLQYEEYHPYGLAPRNVGQKFAIEALMMSAKDAPLVIMKGPAGTAKTLLSMAAGMDKVYKPYGDGKEFRKMLVTRPNVFMDEDIGFLPGDERDKIAPMMRPIYDNLEILVDSNEKERYKNEMHLKRKVETLFAEGYIEAQSVGFMRGRSLSLHWLVVDEAQNLTPTQVKGLITRIGMGSKIILAGDPEQIDHPHLNVRTNGLTYASERMKGSSLCFQMTFENDEGVRSSLANEAALRL